MTARTVVSFEEQTGITSTSDSFLVNPNREVSVVCNLTSGSPATGAKVQITLDDIEKVLADTAIWVTSPQGYHTTSAGEKIYRPVTAVRLSVTDGTWQLQVRQS
ncbi:MAG TPA: hypothetical protein VHP58_02500 [Alphaproteobacteria bacterium]|nr:hypothetical protein [Alphaproteobacteria bacterium]